MSRKIILLSPMIVFIRKIEHIIAGCHLFFFFFNFTGNSKWTETVKAEEFRARWKNTPAWNECSKCRCRIYSYHCYIFPLPKKKTLINITVVSYIKSYCNIICFAAKIGGTIIKWEPLTSNFLYCRCVSLFKNVISTCSVSFRKVCLLTYSLESTT